MLRITTLLAALALALATSSATVHPSEAQSAPADAAATTQLIPPTETSTLRNQLGFAFPDPPTTPVGPGDEALVGTIDGLFTTLQEEGELDLEALPRIAGSGDARAAWVLVDLWRFLRPGPVTDSVQAGFSTLTGARLQDDPVAGRSPLQSAADHLIAWDLPALPGYERWKGQLYALVDPRWGSFFTDEEAEIDWRLVTWGGVFMDDRPFGQGGRCPLGCIPALDDPAVTDAAGGAWYPDEGVVFGISVDGESRAYPRHIMEIHEMVNDELGGRRLGIPYCTLCGSAQAYFTDEVAGAETMPVLRTSGLLSRSNKVMFDLETGSIFDTFTGEAVSGALREAGVTLEQTSVVTSTWGDWKRAHPDTTILAEAPSPDVTYDFDPLRGRDDDGPIFPIGDVDPRLATQEKVLGVIAHDGTPIAFPVLEARAELESGGPVAAHGITVVSDASGLRAIRADGGDAVGHEAFWFAWSQFYPDTLVWQSEPASARPTGD